MAHDPNENDLSAIDKLLAETDEGWDVEAQLLTLKQAAATKPLSEQSRPTGLSAGSAPHKLPIPTPFELSPARGSIRADGSPAIDTLPTLRIGKPKRPAKLPPIPHQKGPPPLPATARPPGASPPRRPTDMAQPSALIELLRARIATLERSDDRIGLARAHIELAVALETIAGDDARAIHHAESALKVSPGLASAHTLLRRKKHGRAALREMLAHVQQEILSAASEAKKAGLLAEKARLLEAIGERSTEVRTTWEQTLALVPSHPAALKGLEAELMARARARGAPGDREDWERLAVHLGRMADGYGSSRRLAAWIHVERARVLERKLGLPDSARAALDRALELDPTIGPVRAALVRHVSAHSDWGALATLLDEEARIEDNAGRAARLELDAAAIAAARLGDGARACALLERAAERAPTTPNVDRRVLDELVRLHEREGRWADGARARRARLAFLTEPAAIAYELQSLASAAEKRGDLEAAIGDVQRALALDAKNPMLASALDRLLKGSQKHEQRIAMWLQEAARLDNSAARAKAFTRAAAVSDELGRRADAIRHLRSAWVALPGDGEVLDALARQLAPAPAESADSGPRALADLYAQAAEHAPDVGRRVAFLERVALIWEELLGDPGRAARAYEQVLALEPNRRSALLGLERTAARMGDVRALARALLDEARLADDATTSLALRARAAAALAVDDPSRAMQLAREVIERDPLHREALALETELEQQAGRWERAAQSLLARIEAAESASEKLSLYLALAHLQRVELRRPDDALASLERAAVLDPTHPVAAEEITRLMEDQGEPRALRDAIERIAARATKPDERARHLARAAEIDELCLADDAVAIRTLGRALAEWPDDELVAERLARLLARNAGRIEGDRTDLAALLAKRIDRAASPQDLRAHSFELAALLVELGREPGRATSLLEAMLVDEPDDATALRTLESLRRRGTDFMPLARILDRQGSHLADPCARLGALWNLASLEEWKLPVGDAGATYRRILELDPNDSGALEATLRREFDDARGGDPRALSAAITALRALVRIGSGGDTQALWLLLLASLLEKAAGRADDARASDDLAREALSCYRDALRGDSLSVTAATGVARLAARFRDTEGAFAAARSLAEIAVERHLRARYLVDAAELLLGDDDDERLGPRPDRRRLAAAVLGQALDADPDSIAAAGRLSGVLLEDHLGERVVSAFRAALARTTSPETAIMLGSEVARVARDELGDLTIAIDAMRRARAAAPQHIPSLLTLAELCIAQRVWPEAVDALEAVVANAHEVHPKLTALFALASIYEKVLLRPQDVDRVLRAAFAADPTSARAVSALLRRIAAVPIEGDDAAQRARRLEIGDLLGRMAKLEKSADQKTALLLELSDVRERLGDSKAAGRALVEAVATSPSNGRALALLTAFYRRPGRPGDDIEYSRALGAAIALGQELGAVDARWFAALGQLEVQSLSRPREGIAHLERAVALDPTLYETRFELAGAYERVGANEDAARAVIGMLSPASRPMLSIGDPAAALALLERTRTAQLRVEEALVVSDLRGIAGQVDEAQRGKLRAQRPPPPDPARAGIDRPTLVAQVVPAEGRHVMLDVAAAIAGVEAKVLRLDLAQMGISARDKIGPRDRHPLRALVDRIARRLGVGEVDLAIAPSAQRTRVLSLDVPWVIVPQSLADLPESAQVVALARVLARIALGAFWLEELRPPHVEALLVAAAKIAFPGYGADGVGAAPLVAQYESGVARALSRRQRKLLDELAPRIASPESVPFQIDAFIGALVRAELRAAFLVTGELRAVLEELRASDAVLRRATDSPGPKALAAVLEHGLAGDLVRFALTAEATALRRA